MATVSKNFRVKNGLVVEGTTATVNGYNILTANNSTDNLTEGTSNLYFTEERVQDAVNSLISAGTHGNITIVYDDETNALSFSVDQGLIPDTDSLSEGSNNLYYTDERVRDAVDALISAGSHQNISITYNDETNSLSFVAENGVADSDTDDLAEGTTNLYFTNQRALDATNAAYDAAGSAATAESNANDYTDGRETAITTAYQSYADTAESDAVATAAADATSKANAAQAAAEATASADATTKANAAQAAAEATASLDATTKANAAQAAAEATASADATTKANAAEENAESYADTLIGDVTVDGTGGNTVTDRIASAVANLVDSSPEALNTLNELAAALGDDPNFATTVATDIGTKVSKSGDSMTGDLTLAADPTSNFHAATKQYVDAAQTAAETTAAGYTDGEIDSLETSLQLYADQAELDAVSTANSYTDGRETAITTAYQSYADTAELDAIATASADATSKANAAQAAAEVTAAADATSKANAAQSAAEATASADATTKANAAQAAAEATASADATTKADAAETNANSYTDSSINALDTDDIEEGTNNLYHTDARAKTAAADLLTGATLQNITITGTGAGLTITAENGIADSDTDDLVEGTSNLYFTDQRAVDALQAVTPVFEEIDVNSIALNVASSVTVAVQNTTGTVYSFDSGTYTSAKFLVKSDTGTHTEVMEVLVTLDSSSNIAITEYAIVNTGGSLADVTAVMNGTDVELQATVVNDNTVVSAYGTLIV
jgi:hypothetical protein